MSSRLFDRCACALFGAVVGAALGAAVWYLYVAGYSSRSSAPRLGGELADWVRGGAAVFAVLGFFLQEGVGVIGGSLGRAVIREESEPGWNWSLSTWLLLIFLAVVGYGAWKTFGG